MTLEASIVVRTFNEQKRLPELFDALRRQTFRGFETIVVDSGSFDRTREIAQSRADRLIAISSHDFTFGYALNVGIRAGRGRFCVALSAHAIPADDEWLDRLLDPLRSGGAAMSYGRQVGDVCSKFSEVEDFERTFGPHSRAETPRRFAVNNANSAIRRDLWSERPFDEQLPGLEDVEWARHWMTRGQKIVYCPQAIVRHLHEETWRQVRDRHYREAVAWRRMSLRGRRSIPGIILRESAYVLADFSRAFAPGSNPVAQRLSVGQRAREIVYYRFHKNVGTFLGFLRTHPLETRREQEDVLFNKGNRSVVVRGPRSVAVEEMEIPEIKPGDALIRVAHVGVCATDIEIFEGRLGYFASGLASYPIVPGHEFSGRIVATGPKSSGFFEGDRIVGECIQGCGACRPCRSGNSIGCADRTELGVMRRHGAYADYVVMPTRFLHRVPADLDMRRAVLTEPLAVVLKGFRRLGGALNGGSRACAVIGAGPLGHLCALVLAHRGHGVTAFDFNPKRRALLAARGIAVAESFATLDEFDVVVEATGDPDALDKAIRASRANAAILLLGLPYGRREFSFEDIAAHDKTVVGSVGSAAEDFAAALALLPKLPLEPYLRNPMPLDDFASAWKTSRSGDVLKVILDVDPAIPARL